MLNTIQSIAANQSTVPQTGGLQRHQLEATGKLVLQAGKAPRFDMNPAYDGGYLPVKGFDAPVIVELATATFERKNIKINADHDRSKVVGHSTEQRIDANGIYVNGLLSKVNESVTRIVTESKNDYPHEASIEAYFPPAEFVAAGEKRFVNQQERSGPFYLARNAVITQVAILDTGACRNTHVAIAARLHQQPSAQHVAVPTLPGGVLPGQSQFVDRNHQMSAELKKFCEANGLDYATATQSQIRQAFANQGHQPAPQTQVQAGHVGQLMYQPPAQQQQQPQPLLIAQQPVQMQAGQYQQQQYQQPVQQPVPYAQPQAPAYQQPQLQAAQAQPVQQPVQQPAPQAQPVHQPQAIQAGAAQPAFTTVPRWTPAFTPQQTVNAAQAPAQQDPNNPEGAPADPNNPNPAPSPAVQSAARVVTPQNIQAGSVAQNHILEMRRKHVDETNRIASIEEVCANFDDPLVAIGQGTEQKIVSLKAHAINEGWDVTKTQMEAMHWKLTASNGGAAPGVRDESKFDRNSEVIEAALSMSAGVTETDIKANGWYNEKVMNEAVSTRYRGMRPSTLVHQTIQAAGLHCAPGRLDNEYIRTAIKANDRLKGKMETLEASGFTTASFPGIMRNVANKSLLAAYRRAPSFIPFVFGRGTANDFKLQYSYSLEGSGSLEKLGPDGEIKHGQVVENEYTKQLETFAKMLSWTRQDMINDDLGALGRTTAILGQMAFKAKEFAAAQFVINPAPGFWDATNTVTNNEFGIDGLTESHNRFTGIVDDQGLPITVGGGNILVPNTLEVLGMQLKKETKVEVGVSTKRVEMIGNPHAGTFECMGTPWISNQVVNQNADRETTWYRFADPMSAPAFDVVYLNGMEEPMIESEDNDFNTLGMQWRAVYDFGFGANDKRYAQRNQA